MKNAYANDLDTHFIRCVTARRQDNAQRMDIWKKPRARNHGSQDTVTDLTKLHQLIVRSPV